MAKRKRKREPEPPIDLTGCDDFAREIDARYRNSKSYCQGETYRIDDRICIWWFKEKFHYNSNRCRWDILRITVSGNYQTDDPLENNITYRPLERREIARLPEAVREIVAELRERMNSRRLPE